MQPCQTTHPITKFGTLSNNFLKFLHVSSLFSLMKVPIAWYRPESAEKEKLQIRFADQIFFPQNKLHLIHLHTLKVMIFASGISRLT